MAHPDAQTAESEERPDEEALKAEKPPEAPDIAAILAERSESELRNMAGRLTKSLESLNAYQEELDVENDDLKGEAQKLQETIKLMMQEMRKLNIASENVVEPTLEEGPLDFVGRLWERVKPRDNQILVSENIGELKRAPGESATIEPPEALVRQLETIRDTASDLLETSGPRLEELKRSASELPGSATRKLEEIRETGFVGFKDQASEQLEEFRSKAGERMDAIGATDALTDAQRRVKEASAPHVEKLSEVTAPATAKLKKHGEKLRKQGSELHEVASGHFSRIHESHLGPAAENFKEAAANFEAVATPFWKQAASQWFQITGLTATQSGDPHGYAPTDSEDERAGALASGAAVAGAGAAASSGAASLAGPGVAPSASSAGPGSAPSSASPASREASMERAEAEPQEPEVSGSASDSAPAADSSAAPESLPEVPAQSPESGGDTASATFDRAGVEASEEKKEEPSSEEPDESMLIEAKITLDDGSVHLARVGARDRLKDVAANFIRDHSLKQWFEEPLFAFLKQAEDDAETFPVTVEGDILEIRKQFKK